MARPVLWATESARWEALPGICVGIAQSPTYGAYGFCHMLIAVDCIRRFARPIAA
jgi:hypothetical protein